MPSPRLTPDQMIEVRGLALRQLHAGMSPGETADLLAQKGVDAELAATIVSEVEKSELQSARERLPEPVQIANGVTAGSAHVSSATTHTPPTHTPPNPSLPARQPSSTDRMSMGTRHAQDASMSSSVGDFFNRNFGTLLAVIVVALLAAYSGPLMESIRFHLNRADQRSKQHEAIVSSVSSFVLASELCEEFFESHPDTKVAPSHLDESFRAAYSSLRQNHYVAMLWIASSGNNEKLTDFKQFMEAAKAVDKAMHELPAVPNKPVETVVANPSIDPTVVTPKGKVEPAKFNTEVASAQQNLPQALKPHLTTLQIKAEKFLIGFE